MNIDKIKNYNQKLLAVLGTVVALIAIVGLIFISFFVFTEIGRSFKHTNPDEGILSDEKVNELQQENKRKQLISYETPLLADTSNLVYIIPVSHKTLNSAEFIDDESLGLLDSGGSYKANKRYSKQYYGDYNNLLIYDCKNNKLEKLFTKRINFGDIRTEYFKDDIFVVIEASTNDTYKDGVVNQLDYKTLFIYSISHKELREIKLNNADVSQINFVENSKDLIIKFGIDHNNDGKFDVYSEPSLIKKYDYNTGELIDIVSENISNELQMNLDGTKK